MVNVVRAAPESAEQAVLGVMRPFHSADGHCGAASGGTDDHAESQITLSLDAWVTQGLLGSWVEVNGVTNQMLWLMVQGSDLEVCPRGPWMSA